MRVSYERKGEAILLGWRGQRLVAGLCLRLRRIRFASLDQRGKAAIFFHFEIPGLTKANYDPKFVLGSPFRR